MVSKFNEESRLRRNKDLRFDDDEMKGKKNCVY